MKLLKIVLAMQICLLNVDVIGSYTSAVGSVTEQTVLNQVIGQGRLYKTVLFGSNNAATLTVSAANALNLSSTNNLSVFAEKDSASSQVTITAESTITGITALPELVIMPTTGSNVTIDGNVVINGNLIIDGGGDLVVNGDLTVIGAVSIGAGSTLTVKGDIVFDGDGTSTVSIAGTCNVEGIQDPLTSGSPIRQGNFVIRNTTGMTMAAVLTTTGFVTFENNVGTAAVTITGAITAGDIVAIKNNMSTGADGVNVSASITASSDIVIVGNSSTGATFDGVQLASTIESKNGNIELRNNSGSTTGHGVNVSAGTVKAIQDIILKDNSSSGAGSGVNIAGTIETAENIFVKSNTSVSGVGINVSGILNSVLSIIFDEGITVSSTGSLSNSGTITGDILIKGNLLVNDAQNISTNITVYGDFTMNASLTVGGDLTVIGGTVDIAESTILTVDNDILFDGNNVLNKYVLITGQIRGTTIDDPGANNIVMQNYTQNTQICTIFFANEKPVNITVSKNIVIRHNAVTGSADNCLCLNGTGRVFAKAGDIIVYNNSSEDGPAVLLEASLEANNILFVDNFSTGSATTSYGVLANPSTKLTAYDSIYFLRNKSVNNDATGVSLRAPIVTTNYYRYIFSGANGKNLSTGAGYSLSAYYTGAGAGPNTFTRDMGDF